MTATELVEALRRLAERVAELRDDSGNRWADDIEIELKATQRRILEAAVAIEIR